MFITLCGHRISDFIQQFSSFSGSKVLYFGVFQFVHKQYQSGDFAVKLSILMRRVRNIHDVYLISENRMATARDENLFFL